MYSRAVRLVREAVVAGMGTADEKELAGGEERRLRCSWRGRKTVEEESRGRTSSASTERISVARKWRGRWRDKDF